MKLGRFDLKAIETGTFRLDGGAMFGVVPKVLWSKTNPADESNRISMAMRALYVEGDGRRLVVDSGSGTGFGEKMTRIYQIETHGLRAALERANVDPDSITDAVATHLHFDHAGGFCYRMAGGGIGLSLPGRTIISSAGSGKRRSIRPRRTARAFSPSSFSRSKRRDS